MSDDRTPTSAATQEDESFNRLIERWWSDHFPGSAVARDTAAWNAAHAAKEALKRLLILSHRLPEAVPAKDLEGSI
jgi:hypothetical protein